MTTDSASEVGSIDTAIAALQDYIHANQRSGRSILFNVGMISGVLVTFGLGFLIAPEKVTAKAPEVLWFSALALFIVVFGVFMAIYRFHLTEVSRAEHYKIGFMRIRVAANNADKEGFGTEVRRALTENAFSYSPPKLLKGKDIESPLPGHPTSDLTVALLNKLLEGVDVKKK